MEHGHVCAFGDCIPGVAPGVVAGCLGRQPGAVAPQPERHVVVVIVAPVEMAARLAARFHAVEVRATTVRSGLERQSQVARVPRAVQHRGLQIGEIRVERQRVRVGSSDGWIVAEELEHLEEHVGQQVRARAGG